MTETLHPPDAFEMFVGTWDTDAQRSTTYASDSPYTVSLLATAVESEYGPAAGFVSAGGDFQWATVEVRVQASGVAGVAELWSAPTGLARERHLEMAVPTTSVTTLSFRIMLLAGTPRKFSVVRKHTVGFVLHVISFRVRASETHFTLSRGSSDTLQYLADDTWTPVVLNAVTGTAFSPNFATGVLAWRRAGVVTVTCSASFWEMQATDILSIQCVHTRQAATIAGAAVVKTWSGPSAAVAITDLLHPIRMQMTISLQGSAGDTVLFQVKWNDTVGSGACALGLTQSPADTWITALHTG